MRRVAIIGGTGALACVPPSARESDAPRTRYGPPSAPLLAWQDGDREMYFLARHGADGNILPHLVNYRANVRAIARLEPEYVIGINAVGGIASDTVPGRLVFPDQLVDYTWGRAQSFDLGPDEGVRHVEFTEPFSATVRERLIERACREQVDYVDSGTYGATQGPRLESRAEIDRLERDGCTIVGMTAMPEAGLAREASLHYAVCALVVNWAPGRGAVGIHAEIQRHLSNGMDAIGRLLRGG